MKKPKTTKNDNQLMLLALAFVIGGIFTIFSAKIIHDRFTPRRVIVISTQQ